MTPPYIAYRIRNINYNLPPQTPASAGKTTIYYPNKEAEL